MGAAGGGIAFANNGTLEFGASFALSSGRDIAIGSGFTATFDTEGNNDSYGGVISGGSTSGLTVSAAAAAAQRER